VGILVAAVVLGRSSARCAIAAVASFAFALMAVQATNGIVSAYLGDIVTMSALNKGGAIYALFFAGFRNWLGLVMTAGLAISAIAAAAKQADRTRLRPIATVCTLL